MRGFQEAGKATGENYFSNLLNLCQSAIQHGVWSNPHIYDWSFGASQGRGDYEPQRIHSLLDFRDKPAAFNGKKTLIESAIEHQPTEQRKGSLPELKIIITDLLEDNDNLAGAPADALTGRYLRDPSTAVGIFGVRNPFNGAIEDMPDVASLKDAADSMPFYVIVAGPQADVRACMKRLREQTSIRNALGSRSAFEIVFAKNFSEPTVRELRIQPNRNGHYGLKAAKYDANRVPIPVVTVSREAILILQQFPPKLIAESMPQVAVSGHPVITAWTCGRDGKSVVDSSAALAIKFKQDGQGPTLDIIRADLKKGTGYLVRLTVPAEQNALLQSESFTLASWTMDRQAAKRISKAGKFDEVDGYRPGKTTDLAAFLTSLSNQMFFPAPEGPVLASYYLYVEAK